MTAHTLDDDKAPCKPLRQLVREGYAAGDPVPVIAARAGTSVGVVHVTAWRMKLRHPNQGRPKKT